MNRPLPERVNVSSVFDPIGEWKFSPFNHDFANCCETLLNDSTNEEEAVSTD